MFGRATGVSMLRNVPSIRTIDVNPGQPAGTLIPHDLRQRPSTAGTIDNKLCLVDVEAGTAVYDFNIPRFQVAGMGTIMPQLMRINEPGTRLFIGLSETSSHRPGNL